MNKRSSKPSPVSFFLLVLGIVCLPISLASGQTGGPPPPGGGGGGGGGGIGTGDGHYIYSEVYDNNGNSSAPVENHGYFTEMSYTKTVVTGNCTITFKIKVLNEPEKLLLEPGELINVEFSATLDAKLEPLDPIAYQFIFYGFEDLAIVNGHNVFPSVGSTFDGTASLKYNGTNTVGKHWFGLQCAGPIIGDGYVKDWWCSHRPQPPITQSGVPCNFGCGFPTNIANGST